VAHVKVEAKLERKSKNSMRALIVSDIHANLPALVAVLAAAPQYDVVWNLVGYGANPNEVVDLVRKLGGIVVRGNHDRACCGKFKYGEYLDFNLTARYAIDWTRKALRKENTEWLSQLPRGPLRPLGRKVVCVHGSPRDEDEYMTLKEDVIDALHRRRAWITFCGHTHWQAGWSLNMRQVIRLKPEFSPSNCADQFELQLHQGNRYLLNPGSVGQPRDGDWRAAFAIYDDAESLLTWHRVPYKVLAAQRRIRRAGLPEYLADRLRVRR
jgi:diadenosine tetraphosphatase ApaH/serine/threonine PP2A family protein phosphatase